MAKNSKLYFFRFFSLLGATTVLFVLLAIPSVTHAAERFWILGTGD